MLIMVGIGHTIASEVSEPLKCPEETTKVIDPKNGVGTMSCKGSEACVKLSNVSCIGHRIYKPDKCYKWECNDIPKSLDSLTDIDIKGPSYDEIEITVTQTPAVAVFVTLFIMSILFMLDPSFAFGAIFGAALAGGDSTIRSLES
jgi:hypothetical protein